MSLLLTLIGIGLIAGGVFILSLVSETPSDEEEWLQKIYTAGEEAGGWAGGLMVVAGFIVFILGLLNLLNVIHL